MHLPRSLLAVAILSAAAHGDTVQLPYQSPDSAQAQWFVQQMGVLQQQGNQPVFSQAGMLTVNGQQPQRQVNTGDYDDKRKELVLTFMPINGGVRVTRRFKFEDASPVRVVDVFENPSDKEATVNLSLLTNTNYGVNDSQTLTDPKKKEQTLGWAASTGAERAAMDLFGGKGAKVVPTIQFQPNNNVITATLQLKIPGKSKRAIVHWHGTFDNADAGVQWAGALREGKAVADLPVEIRRALVNLAPVGGGLPDGMELLRGTASDVVELAGGDVLRGDLGVESYALATSYGEINLPAAKVAGIVTSEGRQWVVTSAGEIFAGKLSQPALPIKLAGGQSPSVTMANVTRLGYRSASAETPEWTLDGPMAFLATGERFKIEKPTSPIAINTRYGRLEFPPDQVAAVLTPPAAPAHQIFLTDGSRLSGVLADGDLSLQPTAMGKPAAFATAALARVQIVKLAELIGAGAATLGLLGDDCVAARLDKPVKIVTAFDTLTIAGAEIRSITRPRPGQPEAAVTTADGSMFRGLLADASFTVKLAGGTALTVPAAALRDYDNPSPFPAAGVVEKINAAVKLLNSDDWKTRESAETELTAGGPSIVGVLQNLMADQPPEARDRLTAILKSLKKDSPTPPSRLTSPPTME
ncbi:MAG: hypothetical protein JWM57_2946 [Phycisphaerales bacterium]|nr:hypothetical protein [Phycisphaerales bacterium]